VIEEYLTQSQSSMDGGGIPSGGVFRHGQGVRCGDPSVETIFLSVEEISDRADGYSVGELFRRGSSPSPVRALTVVEVFCPLAGCNARS